MTKYFVTMWLLFVCGGLFLSIAAPAVPASGAATARGPAALPPENATVSAEQATEAAPSVPNEIHKELRRDLEILRNGRLAKVPSSAVPDVPYYAVYFSAHWCGPCRAFTPNLVAFYNQMKPKHENKFEVIFFSRDRSEDAMEEYMETASMPWPTIKFSKLDNNKLRRYAGRGIPCLVLIDASGKVLSDSYVNDQYVGPTRVMNDLRKRLEDDEGS